MKKKLLSIVALASLLVLGGCGDKTSNPTDTTDTTKQTESSKASETAKGSETPVTSDTGKESASSSESESASESTSEPAEKTAAERHQDYLDNYKDKTASITIQGKVIHYVSYSGSETCNIAIQEGKYGYWMNNVPKTSVEVGKSYVFTGFGSAKKYPSLNMTGGTITATEDIDAPVLTLGDETNVFADSQDAYVTIPADGVVITSAETGKYGFKIGENTYYVSYNTNTLEAAAIGEKLATLGVGCKVTKLTGIWYAEDTETGADTIQICDSNEIEFSIPAAENVTISAADDATEVQATGTLQLSAVVNPAAANQEVVWSSEHEDIATVDANGLVTGVAIGTTKIFATAKGTDVKGEYSLTVTAAPSVPVSSITLTAEDGKTGADIGETVQLTSAVLPENSMQSVTYTSSNTSIATVDSTGLVTFVGDGDVTITAHATDDSGVTGSISLSTVIANLKTAKEIVDIVTPLADNKATDVYSLRGVVSAFKDEKNFIIRDATGLVQGYYINASKLPEGLKAGDVVLVKAKFCKYGTLVEITDSNLVSIIISSKTVEGVATTATKKTAAEMKAMPDTAAFSAGEYIEFDNTKAYENGNFINANVEGAELKISLYGINGFKIETGVWGTFKGYFINTTSKGITTIWVDSFTPNATEAPTSVTVTGNTTVNAGKSISLKATVASATAYANTNENVTWSVANKDETVTDDLATIDASGTLTAGEATGTVVVSATSAADNTIKGTLEVTITAAEPDDPNKALASYSFANTGSNNKEFSTSEFNTLFSTTINTSYENIVTGVTSLSKVFKGEAKHYEKGIRSGTGSANGSFTLTTSKAVSKIVVTGYGWTATDTISFCGATAQAYGNKYTDTSATAVELTFTFEATTTITFTSAKRAFITTLDFYA